MISNEYYALYWIMKTTGYSKEDIYHSGSVSPDFFLPDGKKYEVKTLRGLRKKYIIIHKDQFNKLAGLNGCFILVYDEKESVVDFNRLSNSSIDDLEPLYIISCMELSGRPKYWGCVKIYYTRNSVLPINFKSTIRRYNNTREKSPRSIMNKKDEMILKSNNIKRIRKKLKLSQKDFAKKLGVSLTAVSGWELGKNEPSPLALEKLNDLGNEVLNSQRDKRNNVEEK